MDLTLEPVSSIGIEDALVVDAPLSRFATGLVRSTERVMNLLLLLLILLLVFGGGGFYLGGPMVGGSLGGIILIILIIMLVSGKRF